MGAVIFPLVAGYDSAKLGSYYSAKLGSYCYSELIYTLVHSRNWRANYCGLRQNIIPATGGWYGFLSVCLIKM